VELTASEELVAMDNIDILKANGFDIQVDENAPSTQKIRIVSQPVSKNTMFNMKGKVWRFSLLSFVDSMLKNFSRF
jgi:DNA mismatch repair protein PMS2